MKMENVCKKKDRIYLLMCFWLRTRNSLRGFVCLSVGPLVCRSVGLSVCHAQDVKLALKMRKTCIHAAAVGFVWGWVCWRGVGGVVEVRLGVGCPCPLNRNNIVTPRHLFSLSICKQCVFFSTRFLCHSLALQSLKYDKVLCPITPILIFLQWT